MTARDAGPGRRWEICAARRLGGVAARRAAPGRAGRASALCRYGAVAPPLGAVVVFVTVGEVVVVRVIVAGDVVVTVVVGSVFVTLTVVVRLMTVGLVELLLLLEISSAAITPATISATAPRTQGHGLRPPPSRAGVWYC